MNDPVQPDKTPTPSTNQKAKESLVLGLVSGAGWLGIGFLSIFESPHILNCLLFPGAVLMALIAIVDGHKARVQIKESLGTQTGDHLAVTGLFLGYISVAICCLIFVGGYLNLLDLNNFFPPA